MRTGEPHFYAAIGQGLDKQIHVRRPAAAQAGHRIQERLINHHHLSHGLEHRPGHLHLVSRHPGSTREGRCALQDKRRSIGHRPDHASPGMQPGDNGRDRNSRRHGNNELTGTSR